MKRRAFVALLAGAAMAALPFAARAQPGPVPVVGFLRDATEKGSDHFIAALRSGLGEAGYIEGKNVAVDYAWTDGRSDRLPSMAADLVRKRAAVIVTSAINATLAAKAATTTVPIVFATGNDPVAFKLVASLARPGGNITGVSYLTSELGGKRFGLLHEFLPKARLVALLVNPRNPNAESVIRDVETLASSVGVRSIVLNARTEPEISAAFATMAGQGAAALMVGNDPLFTTRRPLIVSLAAQHRLPAIYTTREFAEGGGLMSYGPSLPDVYHQAGAYAGRILKGEKPAELPVLLPTKFEFIINLKTAGTLGLDVPLTLAARAEEVIE
jgi:putative ABC transport system substrate-binding protein